MKCVCVYIYLYQIIPITLYTCGYSSELEKKSPVAHSFLLSDNPISLLFFTANVLTSCLCHLQISSHFLRMQLLMFSSFHSLQLVLSRSLVASILLIKWSVSVFIILGPRAAPSTSEHFLLLATVIACSSSFPALSLAAPS